MRSKLILVVCLWLVSTSTQAGSKGGSSWSGGSSSSSRPASSSSSSSSRPASSSSWSGGSSKPASSSSSTSKPASSSSWSGGSSPPKPSSSPGATQSKSGSSSWSGGSSSSSGKVTTSPIEGATPTQISKRPTSPGYDTLAKADAKKAESRANYEKSNEPAPSYKTSTGKEVKIDPKDKQIDNLRKDLDHQKWVNRQQREDSFYQRYTSSPSYRVIHYSDPFHPALNYWLAAQTVDMMAMFIYHHQLTMDQARINAMYAQNAALRSKVAAMEAQQMQRDPGWIPPGIDRDLIYDDDYVDAVYNPQSQSVTEYHYDGRGFWSALWGFCKWCFYIVLTLVIMCAIIKLLQYVLFVRRW